LKIVASFILKYSSQKAKVLSVVYGS